MYIIYGNYWWALLTSAISKMPESYTLSQLCNRWAFRYAIKTILLKFYFNRCNVQDVRVQNITFKLANASIITLSHYVFLHCHTCFFIVFLWGQRYLGKQFLTKMNDSYLSYSVLNDGMATTLIHSDIKPYGP